MSFIPKLRQLLGTSRVRTDAATLKIHATDAWLVSHMPDAVVFAKTTRDVSRVMTFAHRHRVPITVRGGGVGYVGGAVPIRGGIVLSLARMNRILEINTIDGVAVVEPGVITGDLQDAAQKKGLFYPPDPASLRESTIGGNISTNAGGPRCVKYGVTRPYILGLEVVLPTGKIIQAGGRTHKNKTGFDLVGIFTGSEGLLGTITKATLKLIPRPPARACLSAGFKNERKAAHAVQQILQHGFLPSALEVSDRFTLNAARAYHKKLAREKADATLFKVPQGGSHLLVELDGQTASVQGEVRQLARLLRGLGALSLEIADTEKRCAGIWNLRRAFSYALKSTGLRKLNEDITIPRSRLVDLFEFAARLQKKHGLPIAAFGHAGDGNIHVNIMVDDASPHATRLQAASERALDELFRQIIAWKGSITGEHGIGLAKKRWWPLAVTPETRKFHRQLKKCLDPRGILNPGKFVE